MPRPIPFLRLVSLLLLVGVVPARAADQPLRQLIDAELRASWQAAKLVPAAPSTDAEFLRRVSLDLAGAIPSYEETKTFLADGDAKKREKLVDKLLADPRFATHQADVWDLVMFGRHPAGGDATRKRDDFRKWLSGKFASNEPYDRVVRDVLLAEQDGSQMFYVQFRGQPEEAATAVSRIFLGTQLQCARCHDHPFESWTQKDFYGMAGFFVRLVVVGEDNAKKFTIGEKSTGEVLFSGAVKDQKPGQKGEPVKPKFLGGAPLAEPELPKDFKEVPPNTKTLPKPVFSRKEKLADWVVAADNPYFARAAVNRIWAQHLGRGLIHPIDDLGEKNLPSHPALFDAMTKQFVAHKYDLKWLIREIVLSDVYQLSGTAKGTEAMPKGFERARVRPLSAEELLALIRAATGTTGPSNDATPEYMLRYFGEPTNGQGDFQGSLSEHLFLNYSSNIRGMIQRKKDNLVDKLLTSTEPWEQRVERLFLTVLNRQPKPEEKKRFVAYLTSEPKADALVEEAIWVLLNTAEFRFNH